MSDLPDKPALPTRMGRTSVRRTPIAVGAAAVVAAAAWALWPIAPAPVNPPGLDAPEKTAPGAPLAALDLDAFHAPIWVAEPAPPPPVPAPPPPPPLRLQLLAITREGDQLRAVLYDPDTDRVHVVADGQALGGRTVDRVAADGVSIRDASGQAIRTLSLRDAGPSPFPGGGR